MVHTRETKTATAAVTRTEFVSAGERTAVERVASPFQIADTINQARATRERTPTERASSRAQRGADSDGAWTNKLRWGDSRYAIASLHQGDPSLGPDPLAGKVNPIYIDPLFATGQDFSYQARVGP